MQHRFPLVDRNGEPVIIRATGEAGIIVGRGSCAYYVQVGETVSTRSAFELDYPNAPAPLTTMQQPVQSSRQLNLF